MQIVKIDAMKKSVTKMTIALLHKYFKTKQTNVKKILLALYEHMSDSKRNGHPAFVLLFFLIR